MSIDELYVQLRLHGISCKRMQRRIDPGSVLSRTLGRKGITRTSINCIMFEGAAHGAWRTIYEFDHKACISTWTWDTTGTRTAQMMQDALSQYGIVIPCVELRYDD